MTDHVKFITDAGWCVRPGLNTPYVVGRQGAADAEFKGCASLHEAAQIVEDAFAAAARAATRRVIPANATVVAPQELCVRVMLTEGADRQDDAAAALCQAAMAVARGCYEGTVQDEAKNVVARFWIEDRK